MWAGADAACNIHVHGSRHCPWCAIGLSGGFGVWAAIVGTQIFAAFRIASLGGALLGSVLAFPISGGLLAISLGIIFGYWR
jgi:hypothetical protein